MDTFLHELIHINGELAHWAFELEGVVIGIAYQRVWHHFHDRRAHGYSRPKRVRKYGRDQAFAEAQRLQADMESILGVHPCQRGPQPGDGTLH